MYGKYLSIDQIKSLISKPEREFKPVRDWLNDHNMKNCEFNGDSIKCSDYIDKVENLFNVKMDLYLNIVTKALRFRSDIPYDIPDDLTHLIDFVDGISNPLSSFEIPKVNIQTKSDDVDSGMFSLEVMNNVYSDRNVSVGAMEYGMNGFSNKHLSQSQVANGVTANLIMKEHIIGDNFFIPNMESELDVQVMFWGAPNATLWYQDYGGWIYGWANDFFNRKEVPEVVSISYGSTEVSQCYSGTCNNITSEQYVIRSNVELMKLALRGITVVVAAGDSGSPSHFNNNCTSKLGPYGWNHINPIFPRSSPWVISVGSTYIVAGDIKRRFAQNILIMV